MLDRPFALALAQGQQGLGLAEVGGVALAELAPARERQRGIVPALRRQVDPGRPPRHLRVAAAQRRREVGACGGIQVLLAQGELGRQQVLQRQGVERLLGNRQLGHGIAGLAGGSAVARHRNAGAGGQSQQGDQAR